MKSQVYDVVLWSNSDPEDKYIAAGDFKTWEEANESLKRFLTMAKENHMDTSGATPMREANTEE